MGGGESWGEILGWWSAGLGAGGLANWVEEWDACASELYNARSKSMIGQNLHVKFQLSWC